MPKSEECLRKASFYQLKNDMFVLTKFVLTKAFVHNFEHTVWQTCAKCLRLCCAFEHNFAIMGFFVFSKRIVSELFQKLAAWEHVWYNKLAMKNKIYVVAALIWKNNKFLACKRPEGKARAHLWEFVGGKVEQGETPEEALKRECKEELALEVEVSDVFLHVLHEYDDVTVDLTLFNCTTTGIPQMLEHEELKWLSPSDADSYEFCPADAVILEKLKTLAH